jgi:5-methylcytosine-specific restriction endonuclease McrA
MPTSRERNAELKRIRYAEDAEYRATLIERTGRWREANPEKVREAARKRRERNRDARSAQERAWRAANPESAKASTRRYREKNPHIAREATRKWRKGHPEESRAFAHNRRARLRAGGNLTGAAWTGILTEFDQCCAYCSTRSDLIELEHMTPLSRGGFHTADNVVPACRGCNRRKGALTALEFLGKAVSSPERNHLA